MMNKINAKQRGLRRGTALAIASAAIASAAAQSNPALLAYWDFDDASNPNLAVDLVYGLQGTLENGAVYSLAGEGHTGQGGDLAVDFGTTTAQQLIRVVGSDWLNIAATRDQMTITFWQKLWAVASTSSFWVHSPSSSGTARGFQAHVPWGNMNIYFDTAGCCTVPTQRLNQVVDATFQPYYDGFFLDYHHFAFVKDGPDKRVYIDGVLFMSNTGANPLAADFDYMTIGAAADGSNSIQGMLDDFAVFAGALNETAITALVNGTAPDALPGVEIIPPVAPMIVTQPVDTTVFAGSSATLSVEVGEGAFPMPTYQWTKNGAPIDGATSASYTIDRAPLADDGAEFACIVTNAGGSETSDTAVLTVNEDTAPPTLVDAGGSATFDTARVWFSEPLDPTTAETASNYQLSNGVTVSSATLSAPAGTAGDHVVILTTSQQPVSTTLTLTVNNVEDAAGNPIAPGSTLQFGTHTWITGYVLHEFWQGVTGGLAGFKDDPRFPDSPTWWDLQPAFEWPPNGGNAGADNYGNRLSCWFVPPQNADYVFYVCSDDASELRLSTDDDPANAKLIARETVWSNPRQWTSSGGGSVIDDKNSETFLETEWPGMFNWVITLNAGERHYLEQLHIEGGGGDNASATFRTTAEAAPTDSTATILTGNVVGTYYDPNTRLEFVTQPTDQVGVPVAAGTAFYSQDFGSGDGGFTVVNTATPPPGPFLYNSGAGAWVADGAEDPCTGPYNSQLSSPEITVPESGAVFVQFSHRYNFETDLWDSGIVRYSVNGGEFTYVPAFHFLANGYAEGAIIGSGIALGLNGFNGESPGYAGGSMITSTAFLGNFNQDDQVVVQFVGAWDDCATAAAPNWVIGSVELLDGQGAVATFSAEAAAHLHGDPVAVSYQWQRDDGAGFGDIDGATGSSYSLLPTTADMDAQFRVVATVPSKDPNKSLASDVVMLVEGVDTPTISISAADGTVTINYTGTLQSAPVVTGPYADVAGAQSPYTVPAGSAAGFYRSAQ